METRKIRTTETRNIEDCKVSIIFADKANRDICEIILDSLTYAFYHRLNLKISLN
jgi:hypothetical protein